jgi:hypothetical protein
MGTAGPIPWSERIVFATCDPAFLFSLVSQRTGVVARAGVASFVVAFSNIAALDDLHDFSDPINIRGATSPDMRLVPLPSRLRAQLPVQLVRVLQLDAGRVRM